MKKNVSDEKAYYWQVWDYVVGFWATWQCVWLLCDGKNY